MNQSRRNFFRAIIPNYKSNSFKKNQDIVSLGHLTIFPVDSVTKINLVGLDLIVESLPEGLRLKSSYDNKNFKLSLNSSGLVQAHLNEIWPATAVLSIFTGEIYNI